MQPYQEASEEINRQQAAPMKMVKNIGKFALTAATGGAAIKGIAPFLSKYIPENLAIKGLSKISPQMAGFISSSMGQGFSFGDIKSFLGDKIEQEQSDQQKAPSDKNIIQKYSPNLNEYIRDLINTGVSPAEAATKARRFLDKKEQDTIKKIEKDYKADWLSIVESIFGTGETAQPSQEPTQPAQDPMQGMQPDPAQQAPMPGGGGGRGNAMLLQMLQEINQKIRG